MKGDMVFGTWAIIILVVLGLIGAAVALFFIGEKIPDLLGAWLATAKDAFLEAIF